MTPQNDLVRLFCKEGTHSKYFAFNQCQDTACKMFDKCNLRKVPTEGENWVYKKDLEELLLNNNIKIDKKYIEYHNADYETVMYFYNNSFKGEIIEKKAMQAILNINETKEIAQQRDHFITLSKNLFSVIKVSKVGTPVFYQF